MEEYLKFISLIRARWLPFTVVTLSVVALSIVKNLSEKPIYQSVGQLYLKTNVPSPLAGLLTANNNSNSGMIGGSVDIPTEVLVLRSTPLAQRTLNKLKQDISPQAFLSNLVVRNIESTNVLEVAYTSSDPKTAASYVNGLMDVYVQNDIDVNRAQIKSAKEFISHQLPQTQRDMLKVEGKLVNFKEKNATLSLSAEEKSNVMGLRALEQEVQKTKAQIKSLDQQSKSIQNMFGVSSIDAKVTGLVQDMPAVRAAITKLKTLQENIKLQSVLVTPSNPKMIELKDEEAVLKQHLEDTIKESFVGKAKQLHQKVRPEDSILISPTQQKLLTNYAEYKTERQGLEKKLQYLYQNIDVYKKKAKTLPSLALQEGHINREIAVNTSAYEALVGKYQELELLENMQISNARIIAPALIPGAPLQNRQQLNLVQGLLGGILMGAAAAFIVENLDKTVKSRQAVQEILNYNLLGCIPPFPMDKNKKRAAKGSRAKRSLDEVVVRSRPNSLISEAFGIVSTNLRVFNSDQKIDSIVISSSSPKEGKTTIAANLALTISNLGGKVLLIDADLRKPAQHKIWQLPNDIGLSNVIEDKLSIENIVHQVAPNLQVLTSGDKDTNPANIFNSLDMSNFLEQVKEDYDFVIVDTAPITVAADVSILGKLVDGIVFVVRPGVSRSNAIRIAAGVLENANQNVLGLVINGTNMYGEYEYNYNYNYNYYNYYSRKKE